MTCRLRAEGPGDAPALRRLIAAAFSTPDHDGTAEAGIVDALRAAGALAPSLTAEGEGGALLGHVAASPVTLDGAPGWFGIGPLCVAAGHRRRGLGQALMTEALSRLCAQGAAGAVLVGDPAYYLRFGFAPHPGRHVAGAPQAATLGLAFGEAPPAGRIRHHRAFGLPD